MRRNFLFNFGIGLVIWNFAVVILNLSTNASLIGLSLSIMALFCGLGMMVVAFYGDVKND